MPASLEQLLGDAIESHTRDLWTSLPARVLAWQGGASPTVTVQPFPATYLDGVPVDLPQLGAVPVCYPGGNGGGVVYPLTAGDIVLLVFSALPVGQFRNSGSEGDPGEVRHHDLSDAFALPLRCAGAGPVAAAGTLAVVPPSGGDVRLGSVSAAEVAVLGTTLQAQIDALWLALQTHLHAGVTVGAGVTGTSPQLAGPNPVTAAAFSATVKVAA